MNNDGKTLAHLLAAEEKKFDMLEYLVEQGINWKALDRSGLSADKYAKGRSVEYFNSLNK